MLHRSLVDLPRTWCSLAHSDDHLEVSGTLQTLHQLTCQETLPTLMKSACPTLREDVNDPAEIYWPS